MLAPIQAISHLGTAYFGGGTHGHLEKTGGAKIWIVALLAITASVDGATAAIKSQIKPQVVEYQHEDTTLEGAYVWDDAMLYADTDHGFTTKRNIGAAKSTGNVYNEKADERSWSAMQDLLRETLGT